MPGMNSGVNVNSPLVTAAFKSALLHQWIIAMVIFAVLGLAWLTLRAWLPAAAKVPREQGGSRGQAVAEPAWRQLLRLGFGSLWLLDGILQAQPKLAIGLPSQVIEPVAASSPKWVQQVVNWAGTTWSYHPMQAGASAVWIQIGIGVWLLAASRGLSSRLAGLVSVGWGLVVWVFGEAFGGIFAPGLTWLFGAPGAALIYCVAGGLIALPERVWRAASTGRLILAGLGTFLLGMAVLQAWPGRGFWQGTLHGQPGTLTSMVLSMSSTPQPSVTAGWVSGFASFTAAHGFAVNLVAVIALAVIGAGLLAAGWVPRSLTQITIIALILFCLADWVLIEDFGFFGGLGTDPNSMIPMALFAVAGYLALSPRTITEPATQAVPERSGKTGWRDQVRPARLARRLAASSTGAVMATLAVAIILVGAAPLAAAQTSRNADPIIAQAIDGDSTQLNFPAPAFQLTDLYGRQVSLAGLHGKVVLLTFLDPVCTTDCPLMAQELKQADQVLGAKSGGVELVAIVANPLYRSAAYTRAFDAQERLTGLKNWLFLTGSLGELQQTWKRYSVYAQILPPGGMIGHPDLAYVIDADGHTRSELNIDPGPGTSSSQSSFAVELSDAAQQVMK